MKFTFKSPSFFLNLEQLEEQFNNSELIEYHTRLRKSKNTSQTVVNENLENNKIIELATVKNYCNIVNKSSPFYQRDIIRSSLIIENPDLFLRDPLKVIFNQIPRSFRIQFGKKEDKFNVLNECTEFFKIIKSSMTIDSINAVIQELFMNAVYDAPREAQRNDFPITEKESELMIAHDQELIAISCVDYYGSLNVDKFMKRLNLISSKGAGSNINLDSNVGGAGIGCYILFNHSLSIIVGVKTKVCTRFTCIFPLKMSQKQFSNISKNIQIIDFNKNLENELRSNHESKKHKSKK